MGALTWKVAGHELSLHEVLDWAEVRPHQRLCMAIYNVKRHRFNAHTLRILFDLFTLQMVYSNGLIAGKMSTSCNAVAKCDGGIPHTFSFMCRRHFRADCSRIAHSCRHFEQKFVTETVSYSKLMLFCFLEAMGGCGDALPVPQGLLEKFNVEVREAARLEGIEKSGRAKGPPAPPPAWPLWGHSKIF